MKVRKDRRARLLVVSLVLGLATFPVPARGESPVRGCGGPTDESQGLHLGPEHGSSLCWEGPHRAAATLQFHDSVLSIQPPEGGWPDDPRRGVMVRIEWPSPEDDFNLVVFDENREFVGTPAQQTPPGTWAEVFLPAPELAARTTQVYTVRVVYAAVSDSDYTGRVGVVSSSPPHPSTTGVGFAPATLASAHFLGAEPQVTIEPEGPATDPDRMFVDWPLTTIGGQIGQLSRSVDGGESFRLLYDPGCAARSRPTCVTGGGGDTAAAVERVEGTVFFSDQEGGLANEALASSTDHGDTFPPGRQTGVTSFPVVDRQWLAPADGAVRDVAGRRVAAFLTTRVLCVGIFLSGIDHQGLLIPQERPQIDECLLAGPTLVDSSRGPGRGWIYQPYETAEKDFAVATVDASRRDYRDPAEWSVGHVSFDEPQDFPWMTLDEEGNAYAVWTPKGEDEGTVLLSVSEIDDPANDPTEGGTPATRWTTPVRVTAPEIGSVAFAAAVAGGEGRVGLAYMGSEGFAGSPGDAHGAQWHTYATVVTGALPGDGAPLEITSGRVTERVTHVGPICTEGVRCASDRKTEDRELLDLIDVDLDADGRLTVAFMDNHSSFAESPSGGVRLGPFAFVAKQTSGPSLATEVGTLELPAPAAGRGDLVGDSTWPNVSGGAHLRSLDLRAATVVVEDDQLVARMEIEDPSAERVTEDLATFNEVAAGELAAERVQYVVRFASADNIHHLSLDRNAEGEVRAFGGTFDDNDELDNGVATTGAAHRADATVTATSTMSGDAIEIRAPLADLGLAEGDRLYGVTALALAGPAEEDETSIFRIMRTVDAAPPFDLTLTEPPPPPLAPAEVVLSNEGLKQRRGTESEVIAVVRDEEGDPVVGASVEWSSMGAGRLSSFDVRSDGTGTARAVVTSDDPGPQTITVSSPDCALPCSADVLVNWGPPRCTIFGTRGDDVLPGTPGPDVLCAFGGDDRIIAGRGQDRVFAQRGADVIQGRRGRDLLRGGGGSDRLAGGLGYDSVRGGAGNDVCWGGERAWSCSTAP
jgi:hypothetical protein